MNGETHLVNAFVERIWELLREAPMPYSESTHDIDEWMEAYGEWWRKYASEDAIGKQQEKMKLFQPMMKKTFG
jgi:hypothetical protein